MTEVWLCADLRLYLFFSLPEQSVFTTLYTADNADKQLVIRLFK